MSWRKWFGMEKETEKLRDRTPRTMQVGDAVSWGEENFVVEQRVEYRGDGGDLWWDYLLMSPKEKYWLGVVEDEGLELTMYRQIPFYPEMPPDDVLIYQEERFHRTEYGFADAAIKKREGLTHAGRVEYWDYESESAKQLCIERWGVNEIKTVQSEMTGTIRSYVGDIIKEYQITIFPAEPEA